MGFFPVTRFQQRSTYAAAAKFQQAIEEVLKEPSKTSSTWQLWNVKKDEPFTGLINYGERTFPIYAAKTRCINEHRQNDKPFQIYQRMSKGIPVIGR